MSHLVLIRNIPGSGGSTMAIQNYPKYVHLEADMWMIDEDGVYCYNPALLEYAHSFCLDATRLALGAGFNVVVSNPFIRVWEIEKYLDLGFGTEVLTATGNFKTVHNVPEKVIERMTERFEPYP